MKKRIDEYYKWRYPTIIDNDPELVSYLKTKPFYDEAIYVRKGISYSEHIDETLEQEANLLMPGGKLISFFHEGSDIEIVDQNGATVKFSDWIEAFRGIKQLPILDGRRHSDGTPSNTSGFKFVRTDEPLFIPKLQLVDYSSGTPPIRKYLWKR